MFAVEFAPLLGRHVSVPGFLLGWLLQYTGFTTCLPLHRHLCMGACLLSLSRALVPMDAMLLAVLPSLYFVRSDRNTLICLHVLALLWFPELHPPTNWSLADAVLTVLWVQSPLAGLPFSALRLLTAVLHAPHVLSYTALVADFGRKPVAVLASFLLVLWCGDDLTPALLCLVGVLEWFYYIRLSWPPQQTQFHK